MNKRLRTSPRSNKPKPLPDDETLADYGITRDDFIQNHRVVTCPHCKKQRGINHYMMLVYTCLTPGEKRVIAAFRQVPTRKGKLAWYSGSDFSISCDEGHEARLNPATGEVEFWGGEEG